MRLRGSRSLSRKPGLRANASRKVSVDPDRSGCWSTPPQIVDEIFGTPDAGRHWPEQIRSVTRRCQFPGKMLERLAQRAAGPVSAAIEDGTQSWPVPRALCDLPRSGRQRHRSGKSLFQNPYPRDFRHGVFKWKSTERACEADSRRLKQDCFVSGVAWYRNAVVHAAQPRTTVESLVDYVIYLSVRGEVRATNDGGCPLPARL